jgi:hypothetical protein
MHVCMRACTCACVHARVCSLVELSLLIVMCILVITFVFAYLGSGHTHAFSTHYSVLVVLCAYVPFFLLACINYGMRVCMFGRCRCKTAKHQGTHLNTLKPKQHVYQLADYPCRCSAHSMQFHVHAQHNFSTKLVDVHESLRTAHAWRMSALQTKMLIMCACTHAWMHVQATLYVWKMSLMQTCACSDLHARVHACMCKAA